MAHVRMSRCTLIWRAQNEWTSRGGKLAILSRLDMLGTGSLSMLGTTQVTDTVHRLIMRGPDVQAIFVIPFSIDIDHTLLHRFKVLRPIGGC